MYSNEVDTLEDFQSAVNLDTEDDEVNVGETVVTSLQKRRGKGPCTRGGRWWDSWWAWRLKQRQSSREKLHFSWWPWEDSQCVSTTRPRHKHLLGVGSISAKIPSIATIKNSKHIGVVWWSATMCPPGWNL